MKLTEFERFDQLSITPLYDGYIREAQHTKVCIRWPKKVELIFRFLRKDHKDVCKYLLDWSPYPVSFGHFLVFSGDLNHLTLQYKSAHFVGSGSLSFDISSKSRLKVALQHIVFYFENYSKIVNERGL